MRRYALRYLPLLILALLLLPIRNYVGLHNQIVTDQSSNKADLLLVTSPFSAGSALYGVVMPSAQDAWAVGGTFKAVTDRSKQIQRIAPARGQILRYQNGSWLADTSLAEPLLGISMSSMLDGWAVGYAGQLAHYDGHTWRLSQAPINAVLCSVAMVSAQEGWAVGFNGTILHFYDQQWRPVTSPTDADLLSVKMLSAQEGWAVGRNGNILHYSQSHWQLFSSPTGHTLNGISLLSTHEGWAVGNQGTILHYRDGVWSVVQPDGSVGSPNLLDVAVTSERTGWIVGENSILTYHKEVWQSPTGDNYNILYAMVMNTPAEGWAVGNNNSIYHYQSDSWQLAYTD